MSYVPIEHFTDDLSINDDDPIIAPLVREQLDPLLGGERDNGVGAPERALMRAMLQDAVLCLLGEAAPANDRVRLADEARCWIRSRSRAWVFSFECVCEALGIDPDYARRELLRMAAQRVQGGDPTGPDGRAPRRVRGLRHCGDRPRRAIHFMSQRRRRKQPTAQLAAQAG
jgi:hypothetical protein